MTRKKTQPLTSAYVSPPSSGATSRKRRKRKVKVGRQMTDPLKKLVMDHVAAKVMCSTTECLPRVFDGDCTRSLVRKHITRTKLSTDADGKAAICIRAQLEDHLVHAATFAANPSSKVATWDASWDHANYWSDLAEYAYRVSGICVRFYSWTAPTNSSGVVTLAVRNTPDRAYTSGLPTLWDPADTIGETTEFLRLYQADACVCVKPNDANRSQRYLNSEQFQTPVSGVNYDKFNGWPDVFVGLRGGPASIDVGEVIIEMVVEAYPVDLGTTTGGGLYQTLLQPPAPNVPLIEQITSAVRDRVPTVIDNTNNPNRSSKTVWDTVSDVTGKFLSAAAPVALEGLAMLLL